MKKIFLLAAAITALTAIAPQVTLGFCNDHVDPKYMDAAQALFNEGVLKGNPDGSCTLDKQVNRIEFAVMAMRKSLGDEGAQAEKYQPGLFTDLKANKQWYLNYAATAKAKGILKGDKEGRLRANDQVNFAEAAAISTRSSGLKMPTAKSPQQWYQPTLDILKSNQVKSFKADYQMTKGDVVVLLNQIDMYHTDISNGIDSYSGSNSSNTASQKTALSPIVKLIAEFEALSSEDGNKIFDTLNEKQKNSLEAMAPNFSVILLNGLCEANPNRVISTAAGPMGCEQGKAFLTKAQQDANTLKKVQKNLQTELVVILTREICTAKAYQANITKEHCDKFLPQSEKYIAQYLAAKKAQNQGTHTSPVPPNFTGTHNGEEYFNGVRKPKTQAEKESFNDFINIMSDMQKSSHNTSMSIINNMGSGNCYVGIDSNCH